jgi:hypothetical protein
MRRCIVIAAVVVLAACSSGSGRSISTAWNGEGTRVGADYVCREYLRGPYVSAVQTTFGAMRDARIGLGGPGQRNRYAAVSNSYEAVWCWTGTPGAYNVYALTTDGQIDTVATNLGGVSRADAHGVPTLP